MKKVKFLAMMLAAGMFAACSDALEDAGVENGGGTLPTTGEGYVKVAINMPTTNGAVTKANDSGILDDGLESEYKVNNAIFAFFSVAEGNANPDANATFLKAYKYDNLSQQDDADNNQVSTLVAQTTQAPLVDQTTTDLYALVILNYNTNVCSVDNSGVLSINGTALTKDSKLTDLQKQDKALSGSNISIKNFTKTNGFTMVSSPLANQAGNSTSLTDTKAQTLVKVTSYETEQEAEANDAARIYVERVVGKVTLTGFKNTISDASSEYDGKRYIEVKGTDANSVYNGDYVVFDGWILNVTNNSTKLVRDVTDLSSWLTANPADADDDKISRFIGNTSVPTNFSTGLGYRIYWAKDGNYSTSDATTNASFTIYEGTTLPDSWNDKTDDDATSTLSYPLYCFENTMDETVMARTNQTSGGSKDITSILIRSYYLPVIAPNTRPTKESFFICGTDPKAYRLEDKSNHDGILSYIEKEVFPSASITLRLKATKGGVFDNSGTGKMISDLFGKGTNEDLTAEEAAAIWNVIGEIKYYQEGESYYNAALIQHFGDAETPWDISHVTGGNKYSHRHLGRFGIVRNNWYEINITRISGPGDPEPGVPEPDPESAYINCEINVLSWAKREQGVDL